MVPANGAGLRLRCSLSSRRRSLGNGGGKPDAGLIETRSFCGTLLLELVEGEVDNAKLVWKISELSRLDQTLEQALAARVKSARGWLKQVRELALELDGAALTAVERAIQAAEAGGVAKAGETLRALGDAAQRTAADASRASAPTQKRLGELRQQLGQLRDEIGALKLGRLPFPTRLLDALNNSLLARGAELPAQPLCKLCEVADERWRPAIEVAFGRKFAIVVAPEDYDAAEKIYHALKATELGGETGRESLINPTKALQGRKPVRAGSLAEKLRATHPVAEAIISDMFGHVVCVERREQLREHDHAILPDGFMARGAFVERTRFYDGNPFVGKRGLEQQLSWKEKRRDELEAEERRLCPLAEAVQTVNDGWRERFDIGLSLYLDLDRAQELPRLHAERDENIAKLKTIDRARFDDLAQQQSELEGELRTMEEERRTLDRSEKRAELRRLDVAIQQNRDEVQRLANKFAEVKKETDISPWLARLEQLRAEILGSFPVKEVAANKFNAQFHEANTETATAWERLKALRRELALTHAKFDDLPAEAETNDTYAKQLAKLNESEIPEYSAKAGRERKNWESLFRTQVLEKLHSALREVVNLIVLLNNALRQRPIGNDRYQLHYRQNPEFKIYHELLSSGVLAREDELWFSSAEPRFKEAIEHFLKVLTEQAGSAEAARLLDYRHYYDYDMEVVEADGRTTSVDRHSGKFSGGENQSPYFIAILASYLRAYRRYTSRKQEPTLGLVPIDEAFSKLSGERIKDCITALKAFDLQGVFSMSTGNIPYAFEHCDWLVVVSKEERRNGKRTEVRNIPVSLARDSEDARRLMGE